MNTLRILRTYFLVAVLFQYGCEPLSLRWTVLNEKLETIQGARVHHLRLDTTVMTDGKGEFYLSNIQIFDTVVVSATGYRTDTAVVEYHGGPYRERLAVLLRKSAECPIRD